MRKKLVAVDLFSGCGGLTAGLISAGFDVRVGVEIDPDAAETYRANFPKTALIERDIRTVTAEDILVHCPKGVDLLVGCAPCQGFCSLTKKKDTEDPRNRLVLKMADLITSIKPKAIMMENVPGLELRGKKIFSMFVRKLKAAGYTVRLQNGAPAWGVVQMADYGLPQSRRRLVLVAGLGFQIPLPAPTHNRVKSKGIKSWKTLKSAIGREKAPVTLKVALSSGGGPKNRWHVVREIQPQVAARLAAAKPGEGWQSVEEALRPKCHKGTYSGFQNVYGRMAWTAPSPTITGGCTTPSRGRFGHPDKGRTTISVREAAILQGFSRHYKFPSTSIDSVCNMIGNAVPPLFAKVIGFHIKNTFLENDIAS